MHLQYFGAESTGEESFYFQDIDEMLESGFERRKRSIKFKQERIFPAQKRGRSHRRNKRLH